MTLNEFLELLSGGSVETSRQYCPQCKRIYFDKSMTYDNCFFCHANLLQKNVIHSWKYKEILVHNHLLFYSNLWFVIFNYFK